MDILVFKSFDSKNCANYCRVILLLRLLFNIIGILFILFKCHVSHRLIIIIICVSDLRESEVLCRSRWLWFLRPCTDTSSISPCRGLSWFVKRIKGLLAKGDGAANLSWKLLPEKLSNSLTVAEQKGSILPKRETSLHPNPTGSIILLTINYVIIIYSKALYIFSIESYISCRLLIFMDDINLRYLRDLTYLNRSK